MLNLFDFKFMLMQKDDRESNPGGKGVATLQGRILFKKNSCLSSSEIPVLVQVRFLFKFK